MTVCVVSQADFHAYGVGHYKHRQQRSHTCRRTRATVNKTKHRQHRSRSCRRAWATINIVNKEVIPVAGLGVR